MIQRSTSRPCHTNNYCFVNKITFILGSSSSTPVSEDMLADLKCSECQNYLFTRLPITWYFDRGNVCGRCPAFNNIKGAKNTALETLIKLLNLPCRWEDCNVIMKYVDIQKHEEECKYRRYECPTIDINCEWSGFRNQLENHFETIHPNYFLHADESLVLNLTENASQHIFHKQKNQYFILRLQFDKYIDSLSFILFYFQKPAEQNQFAFMLTLSNLDESRLYTEKINNAYCVFVSDDKFDWCKYIMFKISLEKIAHLVKCESFIKYSIKILEEPKTKLH